MPKAFKTLRRRGHSWNHKRVDRVYCLLRLNKRAKGKRRLPTRNPEPLAVPSMANECWSMGFVSDTLRDGLRFRTFNVLENFNREILAIEIDLNLPAVRVLDRRSPSRKVIRKRCAGIMAPSSFLSPSRARRKITMCVWILSRPASRPRTRTLSDSTELTETKF